MPRFRRTWPRCSSVLLASALVLGLAGIALGYWTATGTGSATASAGTLAPATAVSATATPGSSTVAVAWTASSGLAPEGYYVTRTRTSDSVTSPACGSSASSLITATSCDDTAVPNAAYTYTVVAVFASWTAPSAASGPVTVNASALDHFSVTPSTGTPASGTPFSVTVVARDASNDPIPGYRGTVHFTSTDAAGDVALPADYTFTPGDGGSHTFTSGVTLRTAGSQTITVDDTAAPARTGSAGVTVGHGAATSIALTGATTALASGSTRTLTATIRDAAGNTVTSGADSTRSVTFAKPAGSGTVSGLGAATAAGGIASLPVTGAVAGPVTIEASAPLTSGPAASALSFSVAVGPPTKLAFTASPGASTGGTAFATQPKVTVQDFGGNTVTGDSGAVALQIAPGTGASGAALACTANPVNAAAGVATFTGCRIDRAGTGYTLTAGRAGLTSATSASFDVTVGAAAQLVFTTAPFTMTASTTVSSPVISVERRDAGGNPVSTGPDLVVTPQSSSTGTKSFRNATDTAAITSVTIAGGGSTASFRYRDTLAGTPTITASSSLTSPTQTGTVTAGAPAALRYTTSSADCASGSVALGVNQGTWTSRVSLLDAFGNPATAAATTPVTISKPGGTGGTLSGSPLSIAAGASETATTLGYQIAAGQPPAVTITAAGPGLTSATCTVGR